MKGDGSGVVWYGMERDEMGVCEECVDIDRAHQSINRSSDHPIHQAIYLSVNTCLSSMSSDDVLPVIN